MIELLVAGWMLSAPCEVRSAAHVAEHGGLAADSAWHVANGDLPTCGSEERSERRDAGGGDGGKSRFCRRRWYC